mmetsp:Transcript_13606/g.49469  ORF Transcript_13606/g.49469 Transcript_13606/m.49469 type:complete len:416 (+) Transcript_13606:173-1420(+)
MFGANRKVEDTFLVDIRDDARRELCENECLRPLLRPIARARSFGEMLANRLADLLGNQSVGHKALLSLLMAAFKAGEYQPKIRIEELSRADLEAIMDRDPACTSKLHAMLFFKGFHALQIHRVAHYLWRTGNVTMALLLQSDASRTFAVDIHPAAVIGQGLMIDHATGVVIGETAKIGSDCTLLHGVTLGGNGKESGDRHPKLGSGVLVGAGASVLGNIVVGDRCKIGTNSVVLKALPEGATAVGAPAKVIGRVQERKPSVELDHNLHNLKVANEVSESYFSLWDKSRLGTLDPEKRENCLCPDAFATRLKRDGCNASCGEMDALFFELDQDDDGVVTEEEFSTWKEKLPVIREKKHQVLTNPCNEAMLDLLISTRVKRASQQSSVTSSTGGSDSRWPSVEATLLRDAHSKYRDR